MRAKLKRFISDKLGDYREGGLPFNVMVDLENPEGTRHFLTTTGRSFVFTTINKSGEGKEWEEDDIPTTLQEVKVSTEATQYGMFLIPEFRTIVILTVGFYAKLSNAAVGYRIKGESNLELRDWARFILRLNATTLLQKTNTFQQHFLKTGKIKGLSRIEIDKLKDSMIPIFINPDLSLIFYNATSTEDYIVRRMSEAVSLLIHLLAHELKGELRGDNRVYYGGYRCYKVNNESATVYAPKIVLLEKGTPNPMSLLRYMSGLIEKIEDDKLEAVSKKTPHIAMLLTKDEEDEDDVGSE